MNPHSKHRKNITGYLFLAPYLLLFTTFVLLPFVFGLGLSFFRFEMLSPLPPGSIGPANYTEALNDPYFWKALKATLWFVTLSVPFTTALALGLACLLAGLRKRQSLYRAAIFLPTLINISVVTILWSWFFNGEFGLFNGLLEHLGLDPVPWLTDKKVAMPSVVLMNLWWTVGGPTIILLAGLHQVPKHYYEAAALDGANAHQQFWHITLPLIRPVFLFVTIMNIIGGFQVFGQTFMLTRGGPELSTRVLVQYIYETAFNNYRMGYGAAMSWLLFAVIAVFSIIQFNVMKEKA
jgi:multiple sugar transport system permease protein